MRRTQWIFTILLALGLIGCTQAVAQQQSRAWDNGHHAGYAQGQADAQAGLTSDFARSRMYGEVTGGWSGDEAYREQYRNDFQAGFRDGYGDGYRQVTVGNEPNAQPAAASQPYGNGYNAGFTQGQSDAGAQYRPTDSPVYQHAIRGYNASEFPSLEDYKFNFQQGFKAGYDDGYYGRAHDTRRNIPRVNNQGSQINASPNYSETAFNNGYRAGYTNGHADTDNEYRPHASRTYRDANWGYTGRESAAEYRTDFRQGYDAGYDDGFNGRTTRVFEAAPRGFGGRSSAPLATGAIMVPAETTLRLTLNENVSTKTSQPGDPFTATLNEPVYTRDGRAIAIPAGATVHGRISDVVRAGRVSGNAELHLSYDHISLPNGLDYRLHASTEEVNAPNAGQTNEEGTVEGKRSTTRQVGTVAAGAGIGAIIGAIAGGGKGAGIGAAVGSAAGLGTILATRGGGELDLPAGTPMEIRLDRSLQLER